MATGTMILLGLGRHTTHFMLLYGSVAVAKCIEKHQAEEVCGSGFPVSPQSRAWPEAMLFFFFKCVRGRGQIAQAGLELATQ